MSTGGPLVLGIETSCDETGIGIVRGTTLLANEIASSVEEHARDSWARSSWAWRRPRPSASPSTSRSTA